MNTRDGGMRELWGTDGNHFVRVNQDPDDHWVGLAIEGQFMQVTPDQALPAKGPLLLELWRTDAGDISVYANGVDISNGSNHTGLFDVSGTGFDQMGSSQWDEVGFEYIMCKGLPSAAQRDAVRSYLNDKWALY